MVFMAEEEVMLATTCIVKDRLIRMFKRLSSYIVTRNRTNYDS